MKKILAIIILTFLTACPHSMPDTWDWGMKPRPYSGMRGFPAADTDYGKGFKDGCEGILAAVSKGATELLQSKVNPVLMSKNPDYATGWWDGMEQCTYITDWEVL
jgi:hypothetical protein